MHGEHRFTEGPIALPLVKFTLPLLLAVFLQAMYGAVDLAVVGRFGTEQDLAAVATGSQIMETIAFFVMSLSMGTTVLIGRKLGQKREEEIGDVVGGSICLFAAAAAVITAVMLAAAEPIVTLMRVPPEAVEQTVSYVRICSAGSVCVVAYHVLGSVFRGLGDSRTPLAAAAVACVCNIGIDLLLEMLWEKPVAAAATATVLSQAVSVAVCVLLIRRRGAPFPFRRRQVRFQAQVTRKVLALGAPIALQDVLTDLAFLMVLAIVNGIGVTAEAAVGLAQKVCVFMMLVPSAYMESLSAFVAQNAGAGRDDRARRAMRYGMLMFLCLEAVLAAWMAGWGDWMAGLFGTQSAPVLLAAGRYLEACAVDMLLLSVLYCFIGYFDGWGRTRFVLLEGVAGAFLIRVPAAFLVSRLAPASYFLLGMGAPLASAVRLTLCVVYFWWLHRRGRSMTPEREP